MLRQRISVRNETCSTLNKGPQTYRFFPQQRRLDVFVQTPPPYPPTKRPGPKFRYRRPTVYSRNVDELPLKVTVTSRCVPLCLIIEK